MEGPVPPINIIARPIHGSTGGIREPALTPEDGTPHIASYSASSYCLDNSRGCKMSRDKHLLESIDIIGHIKANVPRSPVMPVVATVLITTSDCHFDNIEQLFSSSFCSGWGTSS